MITLMLLGISEGLCVLFFFRMDFICDKSVHSRIGGKVKYIIETGVFALGRIVQNL